MSFPTFVDHLVFRISALEKSERFYTLLLGEPAFRTEESVMYAVGETRVFFTISDAPVLRMYDKEQSGLNHIAFGVNSRVELEAVRARLDAARIAHSGTKLDPYGRKEFVWLDDPDGMRIEFYVRPPGE